MKTIKLMFVILIVFSCSSPNQKKDNNSNTKKDTFKYYNVSLIDVMKFPDVKIRFEDTTNLKDIKRLTSYFSYFLAGMKEDNIETDDSSSQVVRLLVIKSGGSPFVIKVLKKDKEKPMIICKNTDGNSISSGKIILNLAIELSDSIFQDIKLKFFNNGIDRFSSFGDFFDISDGTYYLLETSFNGKYRCLYRHSPMYYLDKRDDRVELESFSNYCSYLIKYVSIDYNFLSLTD